MYFGTLVLTRFTVPLVVSFVKSPAAVDLPMVPIDAFDLCTHAVNLRFMLVPNSVGAAFGMWLCLFELSA